MSTLQYIAHIEVYLVMILFHPNSKPISMYTPIIKIKKYKIAPISPTVSVDLPTHFTVLIREADEQTPRNRFLPGGDLSPRHLGWQSSTLTTRLDYHSTSSYITQLRSIVIFIRLANNYPIDRLFLVSCCSTQARHIGIADLFVRVAFEFELIDYNFYGLTYICRPKTHEN